MLEMYQTPLFAFKENLKLLTKNATWFSTQLTVIFLSPLPPPSISPTQPWNMLERSKLVR